MATFRVYQDKENCTEVRQKQGAITMAASIKQRSVLGILDGNKLTDRNIKANLKQSLVTRKEATQTKSQNVEMRENTRNFFVPVAQFEAFKVYEDKSEDIEKTFASSVEQKLEVVNDEIIEDEHEHEENGEESPENMSVQSISSPMNNENSFKEAAFLAQEQVLEHRNQRAKELEVSEYQHDIYRYLREVELRHRPKPTYMRKQPDINHNMRTILVDWLVEVAEEYKLQSETLYLAVNFIDRFLSYMSVVRAKLQLVGTAAMYIASKYEEILPPDVSEFVYITDDTYSKKQVIRMEHLILKVLGFDLSVPTPLSFITAITTLNKGVKDKVVKLAMYLCELGLLEAEPFLEFLPSVLAASAIALAQHTLGEEVWPKSFVGTTGFELSHLKRCIIFLNIMFTKAPTLSQHAIQDKYKSLKYLHVSKLVPLEETIKFD
ncbi:hypothetical protein WA026_009631 [Henosepilachna vigintioctopunctata]|uniref:Cyclin A n=1 Tax=Henosepilachna vigintioctopunctata TaxID=420089 RepID=A0AAW1U5A1_9CUCU